MIKTKTPSFKKHKKLIKLTSKTTFLYKKSKEKSLKAFRYAYKARKKRLNLYRKS